MTTKGQKNHYTLKQLMKKEAIDLKGSMDQYIAGVGGRKGKGKYCNYILISNIKKNKTTMMRARCGGAHL